MQELYTGLHININITLTFHLLVIRKAFKVKYPKLYQRRRYELVSTRRDSEKNIQ